MRSRRRSKPTTDRTPAVAVATVDPGGEPLMDRGVTPYLIVDDEVDVLESLRHLFHRTYRVLTASSGDQASSCSRRTTST